MEQPVQILLAENDPRIRRLVEEHLSKPSSREFQVYMSSSVEEALNMLHERAFDALLLDLSLPEGRGLDVLMRARVAAASVPIIVMAAQEDESLAVRALRKGAQDYLVKGKLEQQLLVRTILNALERHRLIRELEAARRQQHHEATHDRLTGLNNRVALEANLNSAIAYAKRNQSGLAVFFVDLDGFKGVNDSLGHAAGDAVLSEVGARIRASTRASDAVARLGGDEFVLVLRDLQRGSDAMHVGLNLQEFLSTPFQIEGDLIKLSASIGVAFYPVDGSDPETLVHNADAAMYHAKNQGKSQIRFFAPSMDAEMRNHMELEGKLREALQEEQLLLYYQPVWRAVPLEVCGAEALLRWREPGYDIRRPGEFILVAEQSGLIVPIGEWVLESACREWAQLGEDAAPGSIAVNVSARQLAERSITSKIKRALETTGLAPDRLQIEITETAVMLDEKTAGAILDELHELGVRLTMDDFGTGHSSLSRLRRHPFDRIKIDRSFVKDLPSSSEAAALTAAVISMGHALGLDVVAEGVETREQQELLVEYGCDELQGFFLGRPISAGGFGPRVFESSG